MRGGLSRSRAFSESICAFLGARDVFSPDVMSIAFAPARSYITIDPASLQTSSRFPGKTSAQATEPFSSARSARRKRAAALSIFCGALTDAAFAAVTPYANSGGVPAVRSPIVRPAAHQISRYGLPMVFAAPLSFESFTSSVRFKSFVFATAFSASHCRTIDLCNALLTRPQTTRPPALLRERRVVFYYGKDTYFPALGRVYGFYALGGYAAFLFRAGRILPA